MHAASELLRLMNFWWSDSVKEYSLYCIGVIYAIWCKDYNIDIGFGLLLSNSFFETCMYCFSPVTFSSGKEYLCFVAFHRNGGINTGRRKWDVGEIQKIPNNIGSDTQAPAPFLAMLPHPIPYRGLSSVLTSNSPPPCSPNPYKYWVVISLSPFLHFPQTNKKQTNKQTHTKDKQGASQCNDKMNWIKR